MATATAAAAEHDRKEGKLCDQLASQSLAAEPEAGDDQSWHYDDSDWEREGAEQVRELVQRAWPQGTELYGKQKEAWPIRGKHIVASYDESSIVVYQAFCPAIADSAVRDQRSVCLITTLLTVLTDFGTIMLQYTLSLYCNNNINLEVSTQC